MRKNMRIHEDYEAVLAYGRKNLFCSGLGFTKQILPRADRHFCLMLPHIPHDLRIVNTGSVSMTGHQPQNMRIMRIYEGRLFKGFYLPCVFRGSGGHPKHEADMRIHEAILHVRADRRWG